MSKLLGFAAAAALIISMPAFAADVPNPSGLNGQASPSNSADANAPSTPSGAQKSTAGLESSGRPDVGTNATTPAPQSSASVSEGSGSSSVPRHHHTHRMMSSSGGKSTDNNADKLNACQAGATPTPDQARCLQAASNS